MCEIMLSLGHFMVMASHNYDFVKRFSVANASRTKVYHFKVSVGHDGKPVFEYKIEGGQAPSDGVRVAAMKGLDMVTGKIDGKLLEKKRPEDSVEEMHDALIEADDRKKGQKMIIGVDTSWVPAGQKAIWSYSAIKEALAGTGAWKGLANVKICVSDDPEELRDIMENERATPSGTVPVSDMLIIGPEKSCGRGGIMDVYRSDSPGNGAHFALIGIPAPDADGRDPLESADIDLPGLIAMAINKMSAPGSLKEFTLEIPLAEHLDAGEQTRIYELRLKALVRA
jgi:hypothetical protein